MTFSSSSRMIFTNYHQMLNALWKPKNHIPLENDLVMSDGRVKHLLAITHPVFNSDDEMVQIFGIVQDITERKLSESQRTQLQAEQQRVTMLQRFYQQRHT